MIKLEDLKRGEKFLLKNVGNSGIPSRFNNTIQVVVHEYNTANSNEIGFKPFNEKANGMFSCWWLWYGIKYDIELVPKMTKTKKIGRQS